MKKTLEERMNTTKGKKAMLKASEMLTDMMVKFGINYLKFEAENTSPTTVSISWETKGV
jgi:hypothetical protein